VIPREYDNTIWNLIMRFSPAAIALSISFALISSAGIGKKPDHQIDPLSLAMLADGDAAAKAGKAEDAIGWYETALAVDPRNRIAYIAMARAVRSQGLNGKAIRFYKEALELDPNDLIAIAEQGEVMVAKGAIDQAKKNLARLKLLCRSDCSKVDALALNISKAGEKPVLQASAVEIKPVVGDIPATKVN
jgi:tetratricopeptide (TPR) repeat protein